MLALLWEAFCFFVALLSQVNSHPTKWGPPDRVYLYIYIFFFVISPMCFLSFPFLWLHSISSWCCDITVVPGDPVQNTQSVIFKKRLLDLLDPRQLEHVLLMPLMKKRAYIASLKAPIWAAMTAWLKLNLLMSD